MICKTQTKRLKICKFSQVWIIILWTYLNPITFIILKRIKLNHNKTSIELNVMTSNKNSRIISKCKYLETIRNLVI
jgi:hypothetical protein